MHGDSGAGRRSLTPIGLDRREEGDPLVLWSHAMQPVAAVRDGYLADRRADLRLRRSGKDRVAAPRSAAAEDRRAVGGHVRALTHIRDRVAPIPELPIR